MITNALSAEIDLIAGTLKGVAPTHRYLSDLRDCFADPEACAQALRAGNPLLYSVSAIDAAAGDGQLHYALGTLMPGRIGREYYLTKGHYHSRREAAEVYIGLGGKGLMLLENEAGESQVMPLETHTILYVPGHTAHRTINTGSDPLLYLGVYPADAGHDYAAIAKTNFRQVIIEQNGAPLVLDRAAYKP